VGSVAVQQLAAVAFVLAQAGAALDIGYTAKVVIVVAVIAAIAFFILQWAGVVIHPVVVKIFWAVIIGIFALIAINLLLRFV
jgi:hypothetical protein